MFKHKYYVPEYQTNSTFLSNFIEISSLDVSNVNFQELGNNILNMERTTITDPTIPTNLYGEIKDLEDLIE